MFLRFVIAVTTSPSPLKELSAPERKHITKYFSPPIVIGKEAANEIESITIPYLRTLSVKCLSKESVGI